MHRLSIVAGVVLALVGLLWALQGVGVLRGSVMTGAPQWVVIGLLVVALGLAFVYRALRARPAKP